MNKKAALELSSSFLVGIILGIVLLGMGLAFAYNLFSSTKKLIDPELSPYFDTLVAECIQKGEKVCTPEIKKEIPIGKAESFGIVINNVIGSEHSFKPYVSFSRGILEDESEVNSIVLTKWTYENKKFRVYELEDKEDTGDDFRVPINVPPGTKPGTYVFNVNICFDSNSNKQPGKCPNIDFPSLYGTTQQISVTVP